MRGDSTSSIAASTLNSARYGWLLCRPGLPQPRSADLEGPPTSIVTPNVPILEPQPASSSERDADTAGALGRDQTYDQSVMSQRLYH